MRYCLLPFHLLQTSLHCALSLATQCIIIGPVYLCVRLCVCGFVYLFVCGSVTTITRNWCIDLHKTGSVGKGSDHLQLIKFWPSCAPRKGVCGGARIFGSALLQPARSVCVASERFSFLFVVSVTSVHLKKNSWWQSHFHCDPVHRVINEISSSYLS